MQAPSGQDRLFAWSEGCIQADSETSTIRSRHDRCRSPLSPCQWWH